MINDCLLEFASLIGIIVPVYAEVTGMLELLLQLLVCNGDVHDLTDKRYFYIARSNCALSTRLQQQANQFGNLVNQTTKKGEHRQHCAAGSARECPHLADDTGREGCQARGVFPLKLVFGYAETVNTRMPYRQATAEDAWIDESSSPRYNQWVRGIPAKESHEKMRRDDHLYRLGVVVGYNTDPVVAGLGSAIFLHIWKGPGQPTAGCVAMAESDMERIVAWLDPAKMPQIILGHAGAR